MVVASRKCSREDICNLIIVNSERFNWTMSCGFFLHIGGFSTYKSWCLACVLFDLFLYIVGEFVWC
jgi:hypothetical protein